MFTSQIQRLSRVSFPAHLSERIYMREFRKDDDLGRWTPTVRDMLNGVDHDGPMYLMVDQMVGQSRRPGVHIDGYWCASNGHQSHRPGAGNVPSWGLSKFEQPEAIILASSVTAARAYVGEFQGPVGEGGDCSHIPLNSLAPVNLEAGYAYVGNVTCLHESLPFPSHIARTLVRINIPGR